MAEESLQEKTEKATPRQRREAKERGEVARSTEVNSAIILIMALLTLHFLGKGIFDKLLNSMEWVFTRISVLELTPENVPAYVFAGIKLMGSMLAPFVIVIVITGIGINVAQGGFVFAGEPLKPKLSNISPAKGFKRILSKRSLVEVLKGLSKLIIIGLIGYSTLRSEIQVFPYLAEQEVSQIVAFVGSVSFKLAVKVSVILLILAAFDYAYQKMEFEKKLRMTKQEVKEEFKRTEGDPLIKSRIRSIQLKQARQRMLADVPTADVVITNPVHLAVALKYEARKMTAPVVVAKGARLIAEKIKQMALEHGVPIIENKVLARMIYKTTEVGSQIPFGLYKAVAEILAYVYSLKRGKMSPRRV